MYNEIVFWNDKLIFYLIDFCRLMASDDVTSLPMLTQGTWEDYHIGTLHCCRFPCGYHVPACKICGIERPLARRLLNGR